MRSGNLNNVLLFLENPEKTGLIEMMVKNNLAHSAEFDYSWPSFDGENWVVWYRANYEHQIPRDLMDKLKSKKEIKLEEINGKI